MVKGFPDLPPLWWLGSIALIYVFKWLMPSLHLELVVFNITSWLLLIAALGLIAWSGVWFWRKKTPIEPHHTPKNLIVEGPYRLSRNPIYLALVMLTLASAIGNGSGFGLIVAYALWRVLDQRFAAIEEALLAETFPDEVQNYIKKTKRWV